MEVPGPQNVTAVPGGERDGRVLSFLEQHENFRPAAWSVLLLSLRLGKVVGRPIVATWFASLLTRLWVDRAFW